MRRNSFRLEQYPGLASSQELMKQKIKAGQDVHKLLIRAVEQTDGRGRQGREFLSPIGGSYQTIAFKDNSKTLQKPYAAIIFALALAREFEKAGKNIKIKWPNDLYYKNKKLAGILAEYIKDYLIVGIGINVINQTPAGATGIDLQLELVNQIVEIASKKAIENFSNMNISSAFKRYDYLLRKSISVKTPQNQLSGEALGIDDNGCLLLRTGNKTLTLCSGTVIL